MVASNSTNEVTAGTTFTGTPVTNYSLLLIFVFFFPFLLFSYDCDEKSYNKERWIELSSIYVSKQCPTQQKVIFVNSYTEVGPVSGEWHTVDMSDCLPEDAKAINLVGILIITHGLSIETANMQLYFRTYGDTGEYLYTGQVCEASVYDGQRSPLSVWIPLSKDKKFQFLWTRSNSGQWPTWSAYGINLSLNAWGK